MDRVFERLTSRARPLGGAARKHLRHVERHGELLIARLESTGRLSRVHVDGSTPSLASEFDQVAAAGRDPEETLTLLGAFYAIQWLHHNARTLERLAVDLAEEPDRRRAYSTFLRRMERDFLRLVSAYTHRVMRVILPPPLPAPFLICSVGTRGHQDDIDVAVLDEGGPARELLDRTVARLSGQMLRYASTLDHYIARWAGQGGFCMSVEELKQAIDGPRPAFVVITELLRAEPLFGSRELLERLDREIIRAHHYQPGADNARHELYLRGILGEVRGLLLRPLPSSSVNPKSDGLRVIIGLTSVFKVIDGLVATQPRELLRELLGRRAELRRPLRRLQEALVFFETCRHLAQVLVAEEEELLVEGPGARENLERLATAMGYHNHGAVRAVEHMLVHYHEAVREVQSVAPALMESVANHLAETSRFAPWTRRDHPEKAPAELARQFAVGMRALRGVRFWDDVLEALAAPDGELLGAFATSFARQPDDRRQRLAVEYADWGRHAPYALMTLLNMLNGHGRGADASAAAAEITTVFVERLGREPDDVRGVSRVFGYWPQVVNELLLRLRGEELERLDAALNAPIGDREVAATRDRLQALIKVHQRTSRYVKRVLGRLTVRHPAMIMALPDDAALRTLVRGRLAAAERHPRTDEQKRLFGDYYDMEFLRLAMGTLRGTPRADTAAGFVELTQRYLRGVFDVCLRETEREAGRRLPERDLLAIYLTGGYARGRPYDEDYDLISIIVSSDEKARRVADRAVARMNREIARRGLISQYRFGDRFGHFVTELGELEAFLSGDDHDLFVDRCQLLGSQLVWGSPRVEDALVEEILRPMVFERWEEFTRSIAGEIGERRHKHGRMPDGVLHLKEMRGGIREIDLCLATARARLGLREAGGEDLFTVLSRLDAVHAELYQNLGAASDFLVQVRCLYRVTTAASDVIERQHLGVAATILGCSGANAEARAGRLFGDIQRKATAAAHAIDWLLDVSRPTDSARGTAN